MRLLQPFPCQSLKKKLCRFHQHDANASYAYPVARIPPSTSLSPILPFSQTLTLSPTSYSTFNPTHRRSTAGVYESMCVLLGYRSVCELTHTTLNVTEIGYGLRVLGSVVGSQSCSVCKLGPVCGAFVLEPENQLKSGWRKPLCAAAAAACGL